MKTLRPSAILAIKYQANSALIIQRISSAYSKFNDLKQVLTDRRIRLKTRVKFLTACVRSRLTFSVQTCFLKAAEVTKLESVWTNFLRKLIRKGFDRVNVQQIEEEEAVEDQEEVKQMKMKMKKTLTGGTCTTMIKFLK